MSDTSADKDKPPRHDICPDDTTSDRSQQATQKGMLEKTILK